MPSQRSWKLLAVMVVALAIAGAVGWQQLTPKPVPPTTVTVTPTATTVTGSQTVVAATSHPRSFRIFGRIFFDYNGNGKQDLAEPDVPDVVVALNGRNATATNSTGGYVILNVEEGIHRLGLSPPKRFRYTCESDAEFRSAKESYEIYLTRDMRKDIGLMEGFLTIPFAKGIPEYNKRFYVNISNTSGPVDWRGGSDTYQRGDYKHSGTDFAVREGTSIVASAPGVVFAMSFDDPNGGHTVWVQHNDGYYTYYAHLKEIKVEKGQIVRRGELLGFSGSSTIGGNIVPHVHLEVRKPPYPGRQLGGLPGIDPYRSLLPPLGSPLSLWTRDNDPQFPQ